MPIRDDYLLRILSRVETANAGKELTFFEAATAAGFLAFAEVPADVILLEVGLGGRYDSTNVVTRPLLTIITPISIDHTEFLGNEITGIAYDKAGIMKSGVPCVVSPQPDDVFRTLNEVAEKVSAPLLAAGEAWSVVAQGGRLIYKEDAVLLDLPMPRLKGSHQVINAGTAVAAARSLRVMGIERADMEFGLTHAYWPARLSLLRSGPLTATVHPEWELWVDGAHNAGAAARIAEAMADFEAQSPRPLYLICGMMARKDAVSFFRCFVGLARLVVTVSIQDSRDAYEPESLAQYARSAGLNSVAAADIRSALQVLCRLDPGPIRVLICGSLVLAGQVLAANNELVWNEIVEA